MVGPRTASVRARACIGSCALLGSNSSIRIESRAADKPVDLELRFAEQVCVRMKKQKERQLQLTRQMQHLTTLYDITGAEFSVRLRRLDSTFPVD